MTPPQTSEAVIERHANHLTSEKLGDADWWNDTLEGVNAVSTDSAPVLARCMRSLNGACRGDRVSMDAVLTALSQLQRLAIARARSEAEEQAVKEYENGELV